MKVKFAPQNVEFEIKPGESVMHVAQDNGLYIKSVCKGVPSCAECRVRILEGDHNVLSPGSEELSLIGTGHFIDRRRLSCQLKCFGDITVDLSEQLEKQKAFETKLHKKFTVKDDRVEEAVAIRAEDFNARQNENESDLDPNLTTSAEAEISLKPEVLTSENLVGQKEPSSPLVRGGEVGTNVNAKTEAPPREMRALRPKPQSGPRGRTENEGPQARGPHPRNKQNTRGPGPREQSSREQGAPRGPRPQNLDQKSPRDSSHRGPEPRSIDEPKRANEALPPRPDRKIGGGPNVTTGISAAGSRTDTQGDGTGRSRPRRRRRGRGGRNGGSGGSGGPGSSGPGGGPGSGSGAP